MLVSSFARCLRAASATRGLASAVKGVLVVAEHDGKAVTGGTLAALSAATKLGGDVSVLIAGDSCEDAVKQVGAVKGVNRIFFAKDAAYATDVAENVTPLVVNLQKQHGFTHVVAPHTAFGKGVAPRVAALLDVSAVSDIVEIKDADTFVRPTYAGNAITTLQSTDPVKVITVRTSAFAKPAEGGSGAVETIPAAEKFDKTTFVSREIAKSDRPKLEDAKRIVSGGRSLKTPEQFKELMFGLADTMGAAVGATRAAVEAGLCPNDMQVGQTGKIVAPELYIAVGISGAIQHVAGMKDSKVIAVINKDPEAPFFQIADFGLEADLFQAVPEMTQKLKK